MSTDAESLKAVALIVAAVGTALSSLGVIVVGFMTKRQGDVQRQQGDAQRQQGDTIKQVEKTGESVHTLVNSNMGMQLQISASALRRVADMTKDVNDVSTAQLAEKLLADHVAKQARVDAKEEAGSINV